MEKVLYECVLRAIKEVGLENFKKTSLFMSNDKAPAKHVEYDKAA